MGNLVDQGFVDGSRKNDATVEAWREHRRYLLDVAYRMLGTVTEAEDVVQEAFARLLREDIETIEDVRGWLVVVTTRLSLDQLRSARAKRRRTSVRGSPSR